MAKTTSPKALLRLFGVNLTLVVVFGSAATAFVFRSTTRIDQTVRDATFRQEQSAQVHALTSGLTLLSIPRAEALRQDQRAEQQRIRSAINQLAKSVDEMLAVDARKTADDWRLPLGGSEALRTMQKQLSVQKTLLATSAFTDSDSRTVDAMARQSKKLSIQATNLNNSLNREFVAAMKKHSSEAQKVRRRGVFLAFMALLVGALTATFGRRLVRSIQTSEKQREADLAVIEQKAALLNYSNTKLGQSNRDLMGFAFVASHDLQEPLRKIVAFGDRLERRANDTLDETSQDYLRRMRGAASRMQQLIEDLLSYSRTATKGAALSKIDLNTVVAGVMSDLEIAIEQSGATVTYDRFPELEADPTQMRQLVQNLVSNALKFRKPDVAPLVHIKATRLTAKDEVASKLMAIHPNGKEWWRFEVTDNGIGFDQQYADKVFLVFQRLHGRDEYAGSGLGLAVARRIVERHGGEISASSTLGIGTSFAFVLPIVQPEPVAAPPTMIGGHNIDRTTNVPLEGAKPPTTSLETPLVDDPTLVPAGA
jgi:signal transduction histidine kinase